VQDGGSYQRYFFLYETFSAPFMHPGYLATYAGVALIACLYFVKNGISKERPMAIFAAVLLLVELLLLQARINLIALVIVFLLASLYWAIKKKAYKFILAPTAFFVLLAAAVVLFAPQSLKERYLDAPQLDYDISGSNFNSATYRLAEWKCALHVIKEKPLLGVGVGDAKQELLDAYKHFKFWSGIKYQYNAHNQYLETTLALGLVGLFLLLTLLGAYAASAINYNNITMAAAVIFFALCMLTESMFERAWAVILFNLFFPYFVVLPDADAGGVTKKTQ
jgi:O-antigen ligase